MDWGGIEAEAARVARSPEDAAALVAAARAIVAAHGEEPVPKDVDAFVRARAEAGPPADELALAQRAGELLVRVIRERASRATSPEPPAPLPPEVLARLPASYFAQRGPEAEASNVTQHLRRHAWILDVLAIVAGITLAVTALGLRTPIGAPYDPERALLVRFVSFVSGATFLAGVTGFADRAGLLEGPLYDRFGNRTMRLRFLQARGFVLLRGVLVVVAAILLVALPRSSAPGSWELAPFPPRADHDAWPSWMTELGVMARVPSSWTYLETTQLTREGDGASLRVAWLGDGEASTRAHALATVRGVVIDERTAHAIAVPIAREAGRRTDGITCRPQPPVTRADVACVREAPGGPFVIACGAMMGLVRCLASWGPGDVGAMTRDTEAVLREVSTREQ